jgi:hypothetical protein
MTVRSPLYNKIGYGLPTDGSSTEVGFKLSNGSGHCFRRFHRFRSVTHLPETKYPKLGLLKGEWQRHLPSEGWKQTG